MSIILILLTVKAITWNIWPFFVSYLNLVCFYIEFYVNILFSLPKNVNRVMRKQNNFETMWQEEANLWIKQHLFKTLNSTLIYITTRIHSSKKYFCKRSLFPQSFAHSQICVLVVNTFGQTSCCYYYRQQTQWSRPSVTSGVAQIWRDTSRWCHDLCHAASVSQRCEEERGGLWCEIKTGRRREFMTCS